jgi:ligand-binding sensor domain-containing protein
MSKKRWIGVVAVIIAVASAGITVGFYFGLQKTDKNATRTTRAPSSEIERFDVGPRNVKAMMTDGSVLWVGTSEGIVKYDTHTDQFDVYDNKNSGLISNGIFFLSKKIDGRLWVGTYGGGLSLFDGNQWKNYNIPQGLADPFVYGAAKAPNGDVWIATWSGANQIVGGHLDDPKAWRTYTVKNTEGGLPNDWVYGVVVDPKGNIWLGTEGGLALYDGTTWKHWDHQNGLGAAYEKVKDALSKAIDPATKSKHHALQKQEQGLGKVQAPYNPNYVVSMLLDSRGRIWCGTWGGGLSVFKNGKFKTYTTAEGLVGNYISMIVEAPDGTLWAGGSNGLSRLEEGFFKNRFVNYAQKDGLYSDFVFSMAFGEDHSTWVGSYGGVSHFLKGLK